MTAEKRAPTHTSKHQANSITTPRITLSKPEKKNSQGGVEHGHAVGGGGLSYNPQSVKTVHL